MENNYEISFDDLIRQAKLEQLGVSNIVYINQDHNNVYKAFLKESNIKIPSQELPTKDINKALLEEYQLNLLQSIFNNEKHIILPEIYYCKDAVLCMEYLPSRSMDSIDFLNYLDILCFMIQKINLSINGQKIVESISKSIPHLEVSFIYKQINSNTITNYINRTVPYCKSLIYNSSDKNSLKNKIILSCNHLQEQLNKKSFLLDFTDIIYGDFKDDNMRFINNVTIGFIDPKLSIGRRSMDIARFCRHLIIQKPLGDPLFIKKIINYSSKELKISVKELELMVAIDLLNIYRVYSQFNINNHYKFPSYISKAILNFDIILKNHIEGCG